MNNEDKSTQSEREAVIKLLEPLFEQAEREGKWLKLTLSDELIVFTPHELRALHKLGQMVYGPMYWALIDPIGEGKRLGVDN